MSHLQLVPPPSTTTTPLCDHVEKRARLTWVCTLDADHDGQAHVMRALR